MTAAPGLRRGLSAFRQRNYRLYFGGQIVSLVGTWMQQVAQAWLVLQLSGGDPLWLGIVAAAQFMPVVILGLFAGILADTLPKRQTLIGTQTVAMILAALLAILTATGVVQIWMVLVLAIALGCSNAIDMPARQSFVVEMVGPADVGTAVALNSAMFNGARVIGPAVAGITIGLVGVAAAFALNAVSFLAVIAGLALMRDDELFSPRLIDRPRTVGAVRQSLAEGLGFVRRTPVVLLAVTVMGLVATFGMNFSVVVPPLAEDVLHSGAIGYGFLMTAGGLGATIAAISLAMSGQPRPARIAIGAIVLGVALIALAASSSYAISLICMLFAGGGGIAMSATANATIQLAVPDGLRGRVMSVYTTVFSASMPAGGLLMGSLASAVGIAEAIAIGGILSAVTGVAAIIWWGRIRAGVGHGLEAARASHVGADAVAEGVDGPPPVLVPELAVAPASAFGEGGPSAEAG